LFLELWSSHPEGFPLPAGCYFSKPLRERDRDTGWGPFYREIHIVFRERNGLRSSLSGERYQIVMNAQVGSFDTGHHMLDLYSMCYETTGCGTPYKVFEHQVAAASSSSQARAGNRDPKLYSVEVQNQNSAGYVDLSAQTAMRLKLSAVGEDSLAIIARSIIRIYMTPLTQWNLVALTCKNALDTAINCTADETVANSGRNDVIVLVLPDSIESITRSSPQSIVIHDFDLPVGGSLPNRLGVQVTKEDDTKPSFRLSSGMIMISPRDKAKIGQLVMIGRTGYGSKPFVGDIGNVLVVRLQFLATVRTGSKAASISILMPEGYSCSVPDPNSGASSLLASDDLFTENPFVTPFKIDSNGDGAPDNNAGFLSTLSQDGNWDTSSGNICRYVMSPDMAVFAGQVTYVKLVVNNSMKPLNRYDPANVWRIQLSGLGTSASVPLLGNVFPAISLGSNMPEDTRFSSLFGTNAAVITKVQRESMQPRAFVQSLPNQPHLQYLRIFFRTTRAAGTSGLIVLDAPDDFDFADKCKVKDLEDAYYLASFHRPLVNRLDRVGACSGSRYPTTAATLNSAQILVLGELGSDASNLFYAFEIQTQYPATYTPRHQTEWRIWIRNSLGHTMEGSYSTIPFNPNQNSSQDAFYHKSFGMYQAGIDGISFLLSSIWPYTKSREFAKVYVWPISFNETIRSSLRLTAPVGFRWNTDVASSFEKTLPVFDIGAKEISAPVVENSNQLVWESVVFVGKAVYNFAAEIKVPDEHPVTASNDFFLEIGFHARSSSKRIGAGAFLYTTTTTSIPIPAPLGVETFTSESALSGSVRLQVETTAGFFKWDQVLIGGAERKQLVGFGSFLLDSPLTYSYPLGTKVERLPQGWALYRFTWTKLRSGQRPVERVQLGEVLFRYKGARLDLSQATAHTLDGASLPGQDPSFAIDGVSTTKWLDLGGRPLLINFPQQVNIDSYTFFTASDTPERDPVRWRLEGSNDGGITFDFLSLVNSDAPAPQDRGSLYLEWFRVPPCYEKKGLDRHSQCIDTNTLIQRGLASADSPI